MATLRQGNEDQQFKSLDELAQQALGTSLPIAALFSWLNGVDQPVDGWRADVSRIGDGRLFAQRSQPLPTAELRLVFDR